MGDVNGDQIADVAVASHQNGQYQVAIYSGVGQADGSLAIGLCPRAPGDDPGSLQPGRRSARRGAGGFQRQRHLRAGHLREVFEQDLGLDLPAVSECDHRWTAECSRSLRSRWAPRSRPRVSRTPRASTWPPSASTGNGVYQLVATPATNGPGEGGRPLLRAPTGWQATQTIGSVPVKATQGLSVSAGDLTDDGMADIVVGSQANGKVAVYSEELGALGLVALAAGQEGQGCPRRGRLVRGGIGFDRGDGRPGRVAAGGDRPLEGSAQTFQLASSPGSGALVPLGAGYVYRPSTILTSRPLPTIPLRSIIAPAPRRPSSSSPRPGGAAS